MPRLYLTPAELNRMALGLALAPQIGQLWNGALDETLARVSQRVDSFLDKRLQAPGSSTLTALVSAGATSLAVASTLTLDSLAEQAVILEPGTSLQETILIQPGGVSVDVPWTAPYPGTLQLATPLQFGHAENAAVQYAYQEVSETGRASMSDPYSEALQSQAAQLALAHLPPIHVGLNRIQFLKNYPIINVYEVDHSYSFDTTYNVIYQSSNSAFQGQIIVEPTAGFYRYRVGTVVIPEGFTRTTYVGGYEVVPDDVKLACANFLAEELSVFINPWGASQLKQEAVEVGWRRYGSNGMYSPLVMQAQALLQPYRALV